MFPSLQNALYSCGGGAPVCTFLIHLHLPSSRARARSPFLPTCAGLGEGPCPTRWVTCDVLRRHVVCKLGDLLFFFIKWPDVFPLLEFNIPCHFYSKCLSHPPNCSSVLLFSLRRKVPNLPAVALTLCTKILAESLVLNAQSGEHMILGKRKPRQLLSLVFQSGRFTPWESCRVQVLTTPALISNGRFIFYGF